ncbi:hypothetical protein [Deinococcus pimensis]|uniref:hypothetical protein n=1 Tax=Deinococcus pimensis TaxID=309888 RepID=UPI000480BC46|nr:hypothetical protein [Deinococcus pimensis]
MSDTVGEGYLESHDPLETRVLVRHVTTVELARSRAETDRRAGWHVCVVTSHGGRFRVTRDPYFERHAAEQYARDLIHDIERYLTRDASSARTSP